jgi:hypothetical protein
MSASPDKTILKKAAAAKKDAEFVLERVRGKPMMQSFERLAKDVLFLHDALLDRMGQLKLTRGKLHCERGDASGAPRFWERNRHHFGSPWVRVLRRDPMTGRPEAWLWADSLGRQISGEWFRWMAGLTDVSLHPDEHNPFEISEWTVSSEGPYEVMVAASTRFVASGRDTSQQGSEDEVIAGQDIEDDAQGPVTARNASKKR